MRLSTTSLTAKTKYFCAAGGILLITLAVASLYVGKYPLSMEKLLAGDDMQWRVFLTLRLSRTLVGVIGGFALGVAGFVYQTVFRNPLASPDIIGVSSGASAGAAAGAAIGSVIPVLGTAIGALTGGILGALTGGASGMASGEAIGSAMDRRHNKRLYRCRKCGKLFAY
jgi:iron complex transport system permease protein